MIHLYVGVQVHEGPLAVARVDAESQLHLLVQHDKDAHSLLLRTGKKEKKKQHLPHWLSSHCKAANGLPPSS